MIIQYLKYHEVDFFQPCYKTYQVVSSFVQILNWSQNKKW